MSICIEHILYYTYTIRMHMHMYIKHVTRAHARRIFFSDRELNKALRLFVVVVGVGIYLCCRR
jgi:hypothetical protein